MSLSFLNLALLAGLVGLIIPPIIHFFHRRKHDVVDWGAMQFLEVSISRRRKFFLEELLLLFARMALVALLVFFLAQPMLQGWVADRWFRPSRDVVFVIDASASMSADLAGISPWQQAKDLIADELKKHQSNDRAAIVLAAIPTQLAAPLTSDVVDLERILSELKATRGGADGPAAVEVAWEHLHQHGCPGDQEIVLITDRQMHGWFDADAMTKWRAFGSRLRSVDDFSPPRIRWISVQPVVAPPVNFALEDITPSRRLAGIGQKVSFSSVIARHGDAVRDSVNVKFEINGKFAAETKLDPKLSRTEVRFEHRFDVSGPHLVTMRLANAADALAADDRQDLVFEVLTEIPILLVDAEAPGRPSGSTFYLAKAFADPRDEKRTTLIAAKSVQVEALTSDDVHSLKGQDPRVVVLSDVPRLAPAQIRFLQQFVEHGGGLLHILGPRAVASDGGLPQASWTEGIQMRGSANINSKLPPARLDPSSFQHSALSLFSNAARSSLGAPSYRTWAKLNAESRYVSARFTNGDPWLLSRKIGKGQALVSALPMDASWDGKIANSWDFPVLAHELVFALAGARGDALNLFPGQSLALPGKVDAKMAILHGPAGSQPWRPNAGRLYPPPGPAGTYRLEAENTSYPVVVRSDPRESDFSYATGDDVQRVESSVPARWSGRSESIASPPREVWLFFLFAFAAFLVFESWMTRRIAKQRART
ncbi:MAG: VWA domain-containing protein [Gemmataceae bacterium]